jgi:hypothetical protein
MTDQTTIRTTRAGCPVRRGDAWLLTALIALLPAALAQGMGDMGQTEAPPDGPMGMEAADGVPRFPPVMAFAGGSTIFFVHTETSDPGVSEMLSLMMGSPVVTVPALANVPAEALADMYVFTNGVHEMTEEAPGMGPFGFQLDVFEHMPGTEGYSPLRRLNLVTWNDPAQARILRSADEVQAALDDGEIRVEQPGVVVNAPVLMWPLGRR